jgi:hypothetical protein
MKTLVQVWGRDIEIDVYQKSTSVWIAVGSYLSDIIEVKGRNERDAISKWREAARYRGN